MRAIQSLLLVALAPVLFAQAIRIEPSIGTAENEYRQAQEDWLREDTPGLAAELLSGPPAQIHQRIHRAAALRDTMMEKKDVYLDLIIKRFGDTRARLANVSGAKLPVADLKNDLDEQQTLILADQERLEALMRDLPQGDEYALVMRELQAQHAELVNVQNALAQRMRLLDKMDQAQQAAGQIEGKESIDQKLDAIGKIWEEERQKTKEQRAKWAKLYATMDKEVDRGKAPVVAPVGKGASPVDTVANTRSVAGPLPADPAKTPRTFAGSWVYRSQPGAWSGFGEPESAQLTLTILNGKITGTYVARIPGPRDLRDLNLRLTGEQTSAHDATIRWTSEMPSTEGDMTLSLGGDGRIMLKRTRSGDTYVPRGAEILAPR
jgi:hypothetical protein